MLLETNDDYIGGSRRLLAGDKCPQNGGFLNQVYDDSIPWSLQNNIDHHDVPICWMDHFATLRDGFGCTHEHD